MGGQNDEKHHHLCGLILASGVVDGRTLTNGVSVSEPYGCDLSPVEFDQDPAQMTREQFRAYCASSTPDKSLTPNCGTKNT